MPAAVTLKSRIPEIMVEISRFSNQANQDIADAIAEEARERVPRRTGALHDAIHVEFKGDDDWSVVAGNDDAWYGHLVEYGHTGKSAAPQPFLTPAAESQRPTIWARYAGYLKGL